MQCTPCAGAPTFHLSPFLSRQYTYSDFTVSFNFPSVVPARVVRGGVVIVRDPAYFFSRQPLMPVSETIRIAITERPPPPTTMAPMASSGGTTRARETRHPEIKKTAHFVSYMVRIRSTTSSAYDLSTNTAVATNTGIRNLVRPSEPSPLHVASRRLRSPFRRHHSFGRPRVPVGWGAGQVSDRASDSAVLMLPASMDSLRVSRLKPRGMGLSAGSERDSTSASDVAAPESPPRTPPQESGAPSAPPAQLRNGYPRTDRMPPVSVNGLYALGSRNWIPGLAGNEPIKLWWCLTCPQRRRCRWLCLWWRYDPGISHSHSSP